MLSGIQFSSSQTGLPYAPTSSQSLPYQNGGAYFSNAYNGIYETSHYRHLGQNGYSSATVSPIPPEAQSSCESLLAVLRQCSSLEHYSELSVYEAILVSAPPSPTFTSWLVALSTTPFSSIHELSRSSGVVLRVVVLSEPSLISVELNRGPKGFGFSIRGGQEFDAMPLFVLRIAEDGPAASDGNLRVGDQLMEINGQSTKGMTHASAIQLIKQYPTVKLLVRRPQGY
ncbi:unnamed protein product [Toxocara canis]|uniref:PDZ domain-containing protein n=1 Tax=Toxocara canis TaxID=6265 RepID=A0A183USJ2_TOXCA|nr:unnamed protein product [Toxocara canis]